MGGGSEGGCGVTSDQEPKLLVPDLRNLLSSSLNFSFSSFNVSTISLSNSLSNDTSSSLRPTSPPTPLPLFVLFFGSPSLLPLLFLLGFGRPLMSPTGLLDLTVTVLGPSRSRPSPPGRSCGLISCSACSSRALSDQKGLPIGGNDNALSAAPAADMASPPVALGLITCQRSCCRQSAVGQTLILSTQKAYVRRSI